MGQCRVGQLWRLAKGALNVEQVHGRLQQHDAHALAEHHTGRRGRPGHYEVRPAGAQSPDDDRAERGEALCQLGGLMPGRFPGSLVSDGAG